MGIEAALGAAGWSTASAAAASAVITTVGTAALGAVVSKAMAPKMPETAPSALTNADKPALAAEKAPDRRALLDKNAMAATTGALSGNSSTLLTGPQGVNPMSLSLGSSRLLGQ